MCAAGCVHLWPHVQMRGVWWQCIAAARIQYTGPASPAHLSSPVEQLSWQCGDFISHFPVDWSWASFIMRHVSIILLYLSTIGYLSTMGTHYLVFNAGCVWLWLPEISITELLPIRRWWWLTVFLCVQICRQGCLLNVVMILVSYVNWYSLYTMVQQAVRIILPVNIWYFL